MAYSSAKRQFLKQMPSEIKYQKRRNYRIPYEMYSEIQKKHGKVKGRDGIDDIRLYMTALALEGKKLLETGQWNSSQVEPKSTVDADILQRQRIKNVNIDYSILDYQILKDLSNYVTGGVHTCVQDVISSCIMIGLVEKNGATQCPTRRVPPIFS